MWNLLCDTTNGRFKYVFTQFIILEKLTSCAELSQIKPWPPPAHSKLVLLMSIVCVSEVDTLQSICYFPKTDIVSFGSIQVASDMNHTTHTTIKLIFNSLSEHENSFYLFIFHKITNLCVVCSFRKVIYIENNIEKNSRVKYFRRNTEKTKENLN